MKDNEPSNRNRTENKVALKKGGTVYSLIRVLIVICLVVFLGIILIVTLVTFFLNTTTGTDIALSYVNDLIPGKIQIKSLYFNPVLGRLKIENFSVFDEKDEKILGPIDLLLKWNNLTLFQKKLLITHCELTNHHSELVVDSQGKINIVQAFVSETVPEEPPVEEKSADGAFDWDIRVQFLSITLNETKFRDEQQDRSFTIDSVSMIGAYFLQREKANLSVTIDGFTLNEGDLDTITIKKISLKSLLEGETLHIDEFRILTPHSYLTLTGKTVGFESPDLQDVIVHLGLQNEEWARIIKLPVDDYSGTLETSLTLNGPLEDPEGVFHLQSTSFRLAGLSGKSWDLDLNLDQTNKVVLRNTIIFDDKSNLKLEGFTTLPDNFTGLKKESDEKVDWQNLQHEIKLHGYIDNVNSLLGPFVDKLPLDIARSAIRLDWKGQGISLESLAGVFDSSFSTVLKREEKSVGTKLQLSGTVNKQNIKADLAVISSSSIEVLLSEKVNGLKDVKEVREKISRELEADLSIAYNLEKNEATWSGDVRSGDLASLVHLYDSALPAGGTITIKTDGSLIDHQIVASAYIGARDLSYDTYTVKRVDLPVQLGQGIVEVKKGSLFIEDSELSLSGTIDLLQEKSLELKTKPLIDVTLITENLDIAGISPELPVKALLDCDFRVSGELYKPDGTFQVIARDIKNEFQNIPEVMIGATLKAGEQISLQDCIINLTESEKVSLTGEFNVSSGLYSYKVHSDVMNLQSIRYMQEHRDIDAEITLSGEGEGSVESPNAALHVSLSSIYYQDQPVPDIALDAILKGKNVTLHVFGAQSTLESHFFTDTTGELLKASMIFQDPPVDIAFSLMDIPASFKKLKGTLAASIPLKDWKQMKSEVWIEELDLDYESYNLHVADPIDIQLKEGQATIESFQLDFMNQPIIAGGSANLLNDTMDIESKGDFNLAVLTQIAPDLPVTNGKANFTLKATGAWTKPMLDGIIQLEAVSLEIPETENKLHDINAKILVTNESIIVEKFDGFIDKGNISLSGNVDLVDFAPQNFLFTLQGSLIPLNITNMLDARFNLDAKWSGTFEKSNVEGNLIVERALYYQDVDLNPLQLIQEDDSIQVSEAVEESDSFLKTVSLAMKIQSTSPILVENNLASMALSPDLQLSGTAENPVVLGRIQTNRGELTFQKTSFTVQQCIIDFINPYAIDPEIDIVAQSEITDSKSDPPATYTIMLTIKGKTESLDFELTSTPYLEKEDIFALLLLGTLKIKNAAEGGGGSFSPTIIAEYLASRYSEQLGDLAGLDIIEIGTASNADGTESTNISVGKKLSSRLALKYSLETNAETTVNKIIAEYLLLENFWLIYAYGSDGISSGDIKWRIEF